MSLANSITPNLAIITENEVTTEPMMPAKYTDEAIIALVTEDADKAQAYLDEKQWGLHWKEADVLYQSPRTAREFEGSVVSRANIARFKVAQTVQQLVPGCQSGIFYENPPFLMRPRPNVQEGTTRAKMALLGVLMDRCKFVARAKRGMETQCNFGTVIFKTGWEQKTQRRKRYVSKVPQLQVQLPMDNGPRIVPTKEGNEMEAQEYDKDVSGPFFEECDLGSVLVDPKWKDANDISTAKYVIHRSYLTFNDLEDLRENVLYDIPKAEDLRAYFFQNEGNAMVGSQVSQSLSTSDGMIHHAEPDNEVTSADPLERPLESLERWDDEMCYNVLRDQSGRCVIIRKHDHTLSRVPFFAANWWNIPGAAYGMGIGRIVGNDQRIEKGLIDAVLDILSFALNPSYARDRGANISTQQMRTRLGGIVDVDAGANRKAGDAFSLIPTPEVPPAVFSVLQTSQQASNAASGSDEAFTSGNLPGRAQSSAARTATGAGGIITANANRISGPVGHFADGVLIPFVKLLMEMVREFMPVSEILAILGDEMGADYKLSIDEFFNSEDYVETLAGANLAAKKAMAQSLPLMVSILENPHLIEQLNAMGYVVDVKVLFDMFMEMSEWKNSRQLIRPQTPQEKQSMQQANPGAMKVQGDMAKIAATHQAKSSEIDQSKEADLAKDLTLRSFDSASDYTMRGVDRAAQQQGEFYPEGIPSR
jgi:hypothetical protein